jgi:hypothetical protein
LTRHSNFITLNRISQAASFSLSSSKKPRI